jgi:hypothetical protein
MYKSIINHPKSAEFVFLTLQKWTKKINYYFSYCGATAKVASLLILLLNSNFLFSQETIFENDDDSLFYQNPPLPEIKMKAIVRFENKAKVKLKLNNLLVSDIVGYVDNEGNYFNSNIIETDSTILLTNLAINKIYNVVLNYGSPNQFFLTDVNTFSQQGNPIYLSDVFLEKVDLWTSQEESNPTLPILFHFLKEMPELDTYEKLYFFQRMYKDSFQVFSSSISEDVYIEHGQIDWTKFGTPESWNPNNINPCRCNYALKISPNVSPGFPNKAGKNILPEEFNHGRQYFGNGPDVYSHLDEKGNGPAQHHKFKLRVSKVGIGEKTSTSGSALNSTNVNGLSQSSGAYFSDLSFRLVCDRPIYGGALPESCKCEKKIDIYYRYDAKLMADARSLSCVLCNEKGAAVTIEDWTLVSVLQGSTFTVLGAGKGESKAQCNDVGFIGSATNIISTAAVFAATATTAVAAPTPANVTAATTAFTNFMTANLNLFSPNNQSCGTAGSNPPYYSLVNGFRTMTLKTNEPMKITMFNTHLFQTKAKRAGEAKAEKISNYYLAAIIPQNTTQNEFDYCCSKKIAAYNLGSFDGAPLNLLKNQDELGYNLGLYSPWYAPYNISNPRKFSGIIVPHEIDILSGNSGCDMVEVSYRKDNNKPNGNSNLINIKTDNNSFVIQNLSTSKIEENKKKYSVNIYDLTGKVLYSQNNVLENELNKFSESIPYNQVLILNITNQYENKSYKFIRQ